MKVIKGEDMDDKLAACDNLSGIAEGLRGASVAVGEALESGVESNALAAFYADALRGYASRLDALSARIYATVPHMEVTSHVGE